MPASRPFDDHRRFLAGAGPLGASRKDSMRIANTVNVVSIAAFALLSCSPVSANDACLVTPAQLQSATGRVFADGEAATNPGDGSPLCHYAQKDNAKRVLTIGVSSTKAKAQFDSRLRLLQRGSASIALQGVGDRAYFSGTAAGVLSGDTLVSISNLRRAGDPAIASDAVVELLRSALEASGR